MIKKIGGVLVLYVYCKFYIGGKANETKSENVVSKMDNHQLGPKVEY